MSENSETGNKQNSNEIAIDRLIKKLTPTGAKMGPVTEREERRRNNRFNELLRLLGLSNSGKYGFDKKDG